MSLRGINLCFSKKKGPHLSLAPLWLPLMLVWGSGYKLICRNQTWQEKHLGAVLCGQIGSRWSPLLAHVAEFTTLTYHLISCVH